MTRHLFALLLCVLIPLSLHAAEDPGPVSDIKSANDVLEAAHFAFERGEYDQAMRWYLRVAESGFEAPSVWTNAGTAAWRAGRNGEAVLYYKRALKLEPAYNRALQSLDFVSPATNQSRETFTDEMLNTLMLFSTPGQWFLGAQFLFLLACFAVARSMAAREAESRGHWLAVMAWALVFTACVGFIGWLNHSGRQGGNEAVVMVDGAVTRSEPSEQSTAQMELPGGTILQLLDDPRRGFVRVRMADGTVAFISSDSIERI